ncbi:hypothetical protein E1B28_008217 [Marasmius oreades]|uniref:Beta-ketoacyl synthase-like N-terminal domain-containing protein n=1 Tax=Marasmius oreades TaxID=181124 RepID=A0A9P7RY23_9AGAR|nr:uncharacterized protein E1B28_008217 [Marasmius oreades]KAG7091814.1 hypothetical protein E1B28_008217 [Marasmius oreades]
MSFTASSQCNSNTSIAIVGISAEFPSGTHSQENLSHKTFFDFLLGGMEAYEPIPPSHFDSSRHPGQLTTTTGAFLKDVLAFDHLEFGISNRDAHGMSLSTRKLLESSFLALLDSGIHYRGQNVACYTASIMDTVIDPVSFAWSALSFGQCSPLHRPM